MLVGRLPFVSAKRRYCFMQPRRVWEIHGVHGCWLGRTGPGGDCVLSWSWARREGWLEHTAQNCCAPAIASVPCANQTSAPSRAASRISCYTLCNRSVDDSRCSSKGFLPHCFFSRVRFVPCLLFALSSLPWTLNSRVLELIIYVEVVCKAFLSLSQGLWQQDLFPFVFDKSALCVHPKLVGGLLSSCVVWLLCFQGILFAEVSWFLYLVVLAEKAFRFELSRNLYSYWNNFINLKKLFVWRFPFLVCFFYPEYFFFL